MSGTGELDLTDAQLVLRRAVQLERAGRALEGLGPEALEAAAEELGVSPQAVAMALAESRAGGHPTPPRLGERLIGPRQLSVVRPCTIPAAEADRLAAAWLERGHLMKVVPAGDGVAVARRRTDAVASAGRAVRLLHGEGGLSKVREVRSAVGALSDGTSALCVRADVSDSRNGAVAVGSSIGTLAMAGVGVGTVALSPFIVFAAPLAIVAGVAVARHAHQDTVKRVRRSLEETTDAVAHGAPPPSSLGGLGRSLRRLKRR